MLEFKMARTEDSLDECILFIDLEDVNLMRFGNSLEEAYNAKWLPYNKKYNWKLSSHRNERRYVYGFFILNDGMELILKVFEPPIFARWNKI